jgi:hypothetical protein
MDQESVLKQDDETIKELINKRRTVIDYYREKLKSNKYSYPTQECYPNYLSKLFFIAIRNEDKESLAVIAEAKFGDPELYLGMYQSIPVLHDYYMHGLKDCSQYIKRLIENKHYDKIINNVEMARKVLATAYEVDEVRSVLNTLAATFYIEFLSAYNKNDNKEVKEIEKCLDTLGILGADNFEFNWYNRFYATPTHCTIMDDWKQKWNTRRIKPAKQ